jgi:hypothetical protein
MHMKVHSVRSMEFKLIFKREKCKDGEIHCCSISSTGSMTTEKTARDRKSAVLVLPTVCKL